MYLFITAEHFPYNIPFSVVGDFDLLHDQVYSEGQ